jgi:K+-sensing histidine kinase KdpD
VPGGRVAGVGGDDRLLRRGPIGKDEQVDRPGVLRPMRGLVVGVFGVGLVVVVLVPFRDDLTRATPAVLLVVPVLAAAVVGGRGPAAATAVLAAAGFSVGFIPPIGSLRVDLPEDTVALGVFLVVAMVTGTLVAREADRRRDAEQRASEINQMYVDYQRVVHEREALAVEAARAGVLEEIDRQRSMLLRSVSHDLRTPLASIRAVATDLREGFAYDERYRNELLDLMADEAERLDRIVANVLSLSRIEAGALLPQLSAVDLGDLIESSTARLSRLFDDRSLRVEVPPDLPLVAADYVQIDQVLSNLLENAARHTPAGTPVVVRAETVETVEGGGVAVSVCDGGPGIDPTLGDDVFEPFRSGTATTTGVGLAICKAIVDAHGGTLSLCDSPGGGAELRFTLRGAG